ncbi:MAG TPA: DUF58 domain-containing protein, partial [Patescibacteria group bacterium]|nr:DUF58 domain-containing protein [Patescibacteria group bacterium]
MIVPRSRLIFWAAMVVVPCGLLSATEPRLLLLYWVIIAVFSAVAALDALRGGKALAPITVLLPAVARMTRDRPSRLEVRVQNTSLKSSTLRLALVLPQGIQAEPEEMNVTLPQDHEWSRFVWNCLPREKGILQISSACLEISSPLGFWGARKRVATSCEVRVYPNLHSERKNLAALFLNRGSIGLHVQRQVGKGRDFEKLREYLPG